MNSCVEPPNENGQIISRLMIMSPLPSLPQRSSLLFRPFPEVKHFSPDHQATGGKGETDLLSLLIFPTTDASDDVGIGSWLGFHMEK